MVFTTIRKSTKIPNNIIQIDFHLMKFQSAIISHFFHSAKDYVVALGCDLRCLKCELHWQKFSLNLMNLKLMNVEWRCQWDLIYTKYCSRQCPAFTLNLNENLRNRNDINFHLTRNLRINIITRIFPIEVLLFYFDSE